MSSGVSIIINIMAGKEAKKENKIPSSPDDIDVLPSPIKKKKKIKKRNPTFPSDTDPLRSSMATPLMRLTKTPKLKGDI